MQPIHDLIVKVIRAYSLTQYCLLTFNQVFPWSFDNVSTVQEGVALDQDRERERDLEQKDEDWHKIRARGRMWEMGHNRHVI